MAQNLDELKGLKKVKGFDVSEYDGKTSKIAEVELTPVENADFGSGTKTVRQLIIKTENLGTDKENPVIAMEYVSLKFDNETQQFGIPENPNSKAMKFLKFFKVESFDQLIGKDCMAVKKIKSNDKEYIGIHYGA